MRLFDTHCHLDHPKMSAVEEVLTRAKEAGVSRIATIGCAREVGKVRDALEIAKAHADWIVTTIGIHPHDAEIFEQEDADAIMARVEEIAVEPLCVAIGEMGLDFYYDHSPRALQAEVFRRQIALARAVKKPIVIHTREAAQETLQILREERASDVGGIIHCFSEDAAFAEAALDLGFVASFSGIVTFKSAAAIQEAARRQPADAILVETDAPYLAPIPMRGKRNEPAYVAHTARFVAALRGEDPEAFAARAFDNACRVFGLNAASDDLA